MTETTLSIDELQIIPLVHEQHTGCHQEESKSRNDQ